MRAIKAFRNGGPRQSYRGYSLIELTVAVSIALFLIGGLLTLTQGTKNTYGAQSKLAQLQDEERIAMTLITDVIEEAGYFPDPSANTAAMLLPESARFLTVGQGIVGSSTGTEQGDTLTVRYASAGMDDVESCLGDTVQDANLPAFEDTFSVDATKGLQCSVNGADPVPLVPGVQSMTVLYGVKTDFGTDDNRVDSYLRADEMTTLNWANVMSVRITLNFNNPLYGQPKQPKTIAFTRFISIMSKAGVQT